jgi:uncharacterized protein involved in copper resistance
VRVAFAEELIAFSGRFQTSAQADVARLEAAQIYTRVASEMKGAGLPLAEWAAYLDKAEAILKDVTHDEHGTAAALRALIAELRKVETDAQPQTPAAEERGKHLKQLYDEAAGLRFKGKLEEAKKKLDEIFSIDPNYDPAVRLRQSMKIVENLLVDK